MTDCAGTNTIAALLAGAADAAVAGRLEVHLDQCSTCRRLVADLGRGLSAIGDGGQPPAADRLPRPGETIGRYEIRRVIGVGGMGVVYEAHDTTLDRRVAVKLLRPDLVEGASLLDEARAMARLQHPNIATVHDAGIADGQLYICMEYVAGPTLRAWTTERARDWREIATVYAAAGEGLAYVHRSGLVHLDFKPDNVLVDSSGRVRVTDFGLARIVRDTGARPTNIIVGTPAYMPPEQRRGGRTDARSDQFAFCASLREALGDAHAPGWLHRVIDRGRAAHPDDRFATMQELLGALAAGLARGRRRAASAGLIAVVSLVALAVSASQKPRVITQVVDRPVTRVTHEWRDAPSSPTPSGGNVAQPTRIGTSSTGAMSTLRTASAALYAARTAPTRRSVNPGSIFSTSMLESSSDAPSASAESNSCDDGSSISCTLGVPRCPARTVLSIQDGCWTCADAQTCEPLGTPRLHWQWPLAPGKPRPHVVSHGGGGGTGSGGSGGTGSNAGSNGGGSGSSGQAVCGNGFCEIGESFAACAADCCETDASGHCLPTCGNGFCENGEDHASCANDCCEATGSGACVPVCGNGFCEDGETAASCPGECS